jgi:hypothetical protein
MDVKKGLKIHHVIINAGLICAYDQYDKIIPTTRSQRNILGNYKDKNYRQNVAKAFGHPDPFADDFVLFKGSLKITV